MPRVPTYDNFQTGVSALPFNPLNDGGAAQTAATVGREGQALGAALGQVGGVASNIAVDLQEQANQVQVNNAANAARRAQLDLTFDPNNGFKALKGDAALTRPDGQALPDEYGDKLKTQLSSIADGLGNDAQKRAFSLQSNDMLTSFRGDVESHMLGEFRSHELSVQDGTIKIGTDTAKLNWNNPDKIAPAIGSVRAAVVQAGAISGESASETAAKMKVATSSIHTGVIQAALENSNPEYAMAYIERNKDGMTADDLLRARGVINKDFYARVADGTATNVVSEFRNKLQPTDTDKIVNITMQSESGGNRDAVGRFIPGQGAAKGKMQVMDATNADPGYGVTPAKDASLEERARVGRDYITALAQHYAGDMSKAWAAYNWGPGKLDAAVTAGGAGWQALLPAETKAYVAKNMAALGAPAGGAPTPPTLQDIHDGIRAKITAQFGTTPPMGVLNASLQAGTKQWEDLNKNIAAQGENAVKQAQQALISNGGDFSKLPPSLSQAVAQWAPGKMDDLATFAKHIAKGENLTNMEAYNQAMSHPDELAKMPDSVFMQFVKTNFSTADQQKVIRTRAGVINGDADLSAQAINRPAVTRALNGQLDTLGIPTTHNIKGDGTAKAANERLGGIRLFVDQSILDAQRASGQKMTADQVNTHIAGLFAKDVTFKNTLWHGGAGADTSQRLMSMTVTDLPAGAAEGLKAALIKNGNKAPTNTDVINLYRKLHVK